MHTKNTQKSLAGRGHRLAVALSLGVAAAGWGHSAWAQEGAAATTPLSAPVLAPAPITGQALADASTISDAQRLAAQEFVQRGLASGELQANAPIAYTVKRGDTLWGIAAMYLKKPWRWPELWGMNKAAIANPQKIYPGQTLYLVHEGGLTHLSTQPPGAAGAASDSPAASGEPPTVRLSPRTRFETMADLALPTLKPHLIEPFLVQPIIVEDDVLERAPRIVATTEDRVLMSSGDRVYARGSADSPLLREAGDPRRFQIYRNAIALKDPLTQEVLGYEAQYLGKADLVQGEMMEEFDNSQGGVSAEYVPAIITLSNVVEEVRAGDRLLPAPERVFNTYVPRAPSLPVDARVVSLYGSAQVRFVGQNQVVTINKGVQDGMEPGHVLRVFTRGERVLDETNGQKSMIKLPSEANGLAMVFRTFERVSYVLLIQVDNVVRVGDRLTNPQ